MVYSLVQIRSNFRSVHIRSFWRPVEIENPPYSIVNLKKKPTKMENFNQDTQQSNLPKIEIFKTIQKNFATIGISPKLVTQSYPINEKIFTVFLTLTVGVSFIVVYIIKYAQTFVGYTQAIFMATAAILVISLLLAMIFQVEKLYKFINGSNSMANMGK